MIKANIYMVAELLGITFKELLNIRSREIWKEAKFLCNDCTIEASKFIDRPGLMKQVCDTWDANDQEFISDLCEGGQIIDLLGQNPTEEAYAALKKQYMVYQSGVVLKSLSKPEQKQIQKSIYNHLKK